MRELFAYESIPNGRNRNENVEMILCSLSVNCLNINSNGLTISMDVVKIVDDANKHIIFM